MLLGSEAMARLRHAHVAVFGLGGVGSWCAEALARSGVGQLTLIDEDTVGLTNLNRQAQALHSTLGMEKAIAMAQRVLDINPQCTVHPISKRYEAASREYFFSAPYHYVVDAIDTISAKLAIAQYADERGLRLMRLASAMQFTLPMWQWQMEKSALTPQFVPAWILRHK